jgi:hypothetical protein
MIHISLSRNVCVMLCQVYVVCLVLTGAHHHHRGSLSSSYVHTYTHDETTTTMAIDTSQTRVLEFVNDPSAGSPTETLLRLLLPLNG